MTRVARLFRRLFPASFSAAGWAAVFVLGLGGAGRGQTIQLTEVTRFNLNAITASDLQPSGAPNPNYIGNNIVSVAWDGSRMFLAGFRNGGAGPSTGIIELLNTSATGVVASTSVAYGSPMGLVTTPDQRGYTGLAFDGATVFAAVDLGSVTSNALSAYTVTNPAAPTQAWIASGRGGGGVGLDPGYVVGGVSQGGAGVGWATWGDGVVGSSNRRGLNDPATGAAIYGFADPGAVPPGLRWTATTGGVFGRDIAFDPDTGDVYGRYNDTVSKAVRTGINDAGSQAIIADTGTGSASNYQTIAFMDDTSVAGDLLIWNQRGGGPGRSFTSAVRLTDTSGTAQTAAWNFLGGVVPTSASSIYDYAFDPATQTLAVVSASNSLSGGSTASIFRFGAPPVDTQLQWAADGTIAGGSGFWDEVATTWLGAYGPSAWVPTANALFGGSQGGGSVTVAAGGVSVGRGMSFVTDAYVIGGGSITLAGASAPTNNLFVGSGLTATVNSALVAASGLSKSGEGTLVVGGAISGGPLFVNNGTLVAAATASIASTPGISVLATGNLDVSQLTGGLALASGQGIAGGGTVTGSVTVGSGTTVSPGSNLGTLSVTQGVTWANGGNYNWQIVDAAGTAGTNPGWDLLSVGGALDLTATSADPFKINLWSLSGVNPDANGAAANFTASQAYTWKIASAAGGITGFAADAFTINTAAANGAAGFANGLSGGTFSVAQAGNDLNLVFTPGSGPSGIVIDVPSGSVTQGQAGYPQIASATSVTKTGAGTVVFDAANAYTGPTTVSAGTLQVANADALAATAVTVASNATLQVASGTTMKAPSVTVNGGTLAAGALAVNAATGIQTLTVNAGTVASSAAVVVGPGGLVDLPDAARVTVGVTSLAVDHATGGGRIDLGAGEVRIAAGGISGADLRADIIAGLGGGGWNGATGISSGVAASAGGTRAVGYVVDGTGAARVSFAAPGDTTLDGQVDLLDLLEILGSGTYEAQVPSVWSQGDFNYDGVTDLLDLLAILGSGTYDQGSYFPSAPSASSFNAVPEPGVAGWIAVAAAAGGLALRRRGRGQLAR